MHEMHQNHHELKKQGQANFDLDTFEEGINNFYYFEQNPEMAVLLYLLNSGSEQFHDIDELNVKKEAEMLKEIALCRLVKEIQDEVLSPQEHEQLVKDFDETRLWWTS